MSQKNSEILGNKRIELSLLESEYPGFIFVEEPIFYEDPTLVEDPLIDSLTGMTNSPTGDDVPPIGDRATGLYNAQFTIDTRHKKHYRVTGSVTVEISEEHMDILTVYPIFLKSTLWGEDSGPDDWEEDSGPDDKLFSFPAQRITAPGIYRFSAIVPRRTLDEDKSFRFPKLGRDEVYNEFSIVSESSLSFPSINLNSSTKHGYFG
jgi:hypothetical protein